ncbi:MAG: hypothetical protein NTW21_41755 [Verrucomicrobia bacterium]|nr:hypothetical protein [Verrucomicrobiota bacterium]
MYPNADAINALCAQVEPLDGDAAGKARLEVIDGTDRVSFLGVARLPVERARRLTRKVDSHLSRFVLNWLRP